MIPIFSLLMVLVFSMFIVRVATSALTLTGLSRPLARFQARSAFTGAGFTTSESEKVVHHPVRRRIIMLLMLSGNAGIVTAVSSLMLSFIGTEDSSGLTGQLWFRMVLLGAGLALLLTLAYSSWIDRRMNRIITWTLKRWTNLEVRDYAGLLRLSGEYAVVELHVEESDWLADRELSDVRLFDEGILVLGIQKLDGSYLGAPRGPNKLIAGDTVILYGTRDVIENLDERRAGTEGNWDHHKAVDRQRRVEKEALELEETIQTDETAWSA